MKVPKSVRRVRLRQVCDGHVQFQSERVTNPVEIVRAVLPWYKGADREIMSVLCLDSRCAPTGFHVAAMGGLNVSRARPVDVLKAAVLSNAAGIVLIHNHPSGVLDPSEDDVRFTRSMNRACELLGIELYDHLVLTDSGFTSLRERGLL